MIAPAARSRATSGASRLVTLFASARLPAVVGKRAGRFDIVLDQDRLAGKRAVRTPTQSIRRACSIAVGIEREDRAQLWIDALHALDRCAVAAWAGPGGCCATAV